ICISLILCAIFTLLIPYVVLGDSSANPNENGASINNVNQNHEETAGKVVLSSSRKTMTIVILLLAGYFLYVSIGPFFSLCPDLLGVENSGTGIGVMDAAAYGFAALGTASIGAIVDYRGYGLAFWFMAGCALAGSFCIILVKENKENFYVQTN
ncbi:MAG: hypothetical protein JW709_05180, partial [Sedimentisphaerales bacterium]|nr:hypothetical protein [Sedimentisphaerales bacterium]